MSTIKRVPIRIDDGGVPRGGAPVTQGIAFAEGDLQTDTPMRLLDRGRELPLQTGVLATWRPDRRDVKWLLVDFQVEGQADERDYVLEYGDAIAPLAPEVAVTVEDSRSSVVLSSGPLTLTLRREADFLVGLTLDGRELLADVHPSLVMRDGNGRTYDTRWSPLQPMIEMEDVGPIRSSVKVTGYHADVEGRLFCPFVLRVHLFAGRRDLRMHHTFMLDQDPSRTLLKSIAMHWPFAESITRAVVGGENGQSHAGRGGTVQFLQSAHDHYNVLANEDVIGTGSQTQGWVRADSPTGSIQAVVRDAWQQYPKGFCITPEAMDVEFWPHDAEALSYDNPYKRTPLRFPGRKALDEAVFVQCLADNPDAPLNLKTIGCATAEEVEHVMDLVRRYASDRPHAFCDVDIAAAWGTAKTHECWLRFDDKPLMDEDCERYAAGVQQPVLAQPDPAYTCGTGAVRIMHPRDGRFPEAELELERIFERLAREPQEQCRIFGMLYYGELINGHNTSDPLVYRSYLRDPSHWGDVLKVLGTFNNESQDVINQLWTYYIRTGERKYYTVADAKTRHTVDVDWTHCHPPLAHVFPNPNTPSRCVGLMHYHSVLNWSGPWVGSHSLVSGLMAHYYLTGDRRSLEVAISTADNHVRDQTPDGLIRGRGINREITGPLQNLIEVYRATWNVQYLHVIRATLAKLHSLRNDTGNLPGMIDTGVGAHGTLTQTRANGNRTNYPGGMLCYVLHDAWEMLDETWLRDWIIQLAEAWVHGVRCDEYLPATQIVEEHVPGTTMSAYKVADDWYWHSYSDYSNYHFDVLVATAWRLTGREAFLAYLDHRLRSFPQPARDAWRCFSGHAFNVINHLGDAVPAMMACVAEADDELLSRAAHRWRERRQQEGWPVYEGPRVGYGEHGEPPGPVVKLRVKMPPDAAR